MLKYCKIIDKEKGLIQVALGTNEKFYKSIGFESMEVEEVEGQYYLKGQAPQKTLEELKQEKILKLRKNANNYIITKYPYYRQLNIIRNGTKEELSEMSYFIDNIRNRVNQLELDINSSNTEEELTIINYDIYDDNK